MPRSFIETKQEYLGWSQHLGKNLGLHERFTPRTVLLALMTYVKTRHPNYPATQRAISDLQDDKQEFPAVLNGLYAFVESSASNTAPKEFIQGLALFALRFYPARQSADEKALPEEIRQRLESAHPELAYHFADDVISFLSMGISTDKLWLSAILYGDELSQVFANITRIGLERTKYFTISVLRHTKPDINQVFSDGHTLFSLIMKQGDTDSVRHCLENQPCLISITNTDAVHRVFSELLQLPPADNPARALPKGETFLSMATNLLGSATLAADAIRRGHLIWSIPEGERRNQAISFLCTHDLLGQAALTSKSLQTHLPCKNEALAQICRLPKANPQYIEFALKLIGNSIRADETEGGKLYRFYDKADRFHHVARVIYYLRSKNPLHALYHALKFHYLTNRLKLFAHYLLIYTYCALDNRKDAEEHLKLIIKHASEEPCRHTNSLSFIIALSDTLPEFYSLETLGNSLGDPTSTLPDGLAPVMHIPFFHCTSMGQKPLGSGKGGAVYSAIVAEDDQHVALKFPDSLLIKSEASPNAGINEINCMRKLELEGVPNVMRCLGICVLSDHLSIAFVMPLMKRSVRSLLDAAEPSDAPTFMRICRDITNAIKETHASGVLHLDTHTRNCLQHPDGRWMLSDFGLSVTPSASQWANGYAVSRETKAPHFPPEFSERQYPASDIYRFGIMLHEMQGEIYFEKVASTAFSTMAPFMKAAFALIAQSCTQAEIRHRPDAQELCDLLQWTFNACGFYVRAFGRNRREIAPKRFPDKKAAQPFRQKLPQITTLMINACIHSKRNNSFPTDRPYHLFLKTAISLYEAHTLHEPCFDGAVAKNLVEMFKLLGDRATPDLFSSWLERAFPAKQYPDFTQEVLFELYQQIEFRSFYTIDAASAESTSATIAALAALAKPAVEHSVANGARVQ